MDLSREKKIRINIFLITYDVLKQFHLEKTDRNYRAFPHLTLSLTNWGDKQGEKNPVICNQIRLGDKKFFFKLHLQLSLQPPQGRQTLCRSPVLGTAANPVCSSEQLPGSSSPASELPDVGREYLSFLPATNKPCSLSELLCNFITSDMRLSKI